MASFVQTAISQELEEQIKSIQKTIKEVFGLEISKVKASKVIAYKSKISKLPLTEKKLIEILGGKI